MNNTSTSSVRATNKLIPELRFAEFLNEEEWNEDSVDNLFDLQDGYPFSSFDFTDNEINSRQVVRITDINNQNKSLEKVFIAEEKIKNFEFQKFKVEKGNLLLSLTGVAGFNFFIWKGEDALLNQRTMKIFPKDDSNQALIILLEPLIHEKINLLGTGQNNNLSKEALKEIKLVFPKPKEQQKIADCLISLGEVITAHTNKLETLKIYKKGLMQNLFPQEGEKVPKLRFKEFEKYGEWNEKTLNNLTTKISDGIHTTPSYTDPEDYYFINGNNLISGKIWIDEKTKKVSKEEYIKHQRDLNDTTILLSINGTIGNIAEYNNEKVILGKSACYINVDKTKADKTFIIYFIQTDLIKKYFELELTGSTIKNLSLKTIKEAIIKIPYNPKEQRKIAQTLSSLDDVIKEQSNKIEELKAHKKGLMQGLFPKVKN